MGKQLIFVVETNKNCKSDWIYIKETIEQFFSYDNSNIKLTPIYMGGKGNYQRKKAEIDRAINAYKKSQNAETNVIYCFDTDDYETNPTDRIFLDTAMSYCTANSSDFVWFSKDIENVYLGSSVSDSDKKQEAEKFKAKGVIANTDSKKLKSISIKKGSSNLMNILSKYLSEKTVKT